MGPGAGGGTISADKTAGWAYAEDFIPEPDVLVRARARAQHLGCPVPSPASCALLRTVARAGSARAVVEVGTSAGVTALWLLAGMPPDGILTTIDAQADHQRAARIALREAATPAARTRIINSRPGEVLPRLADGAYDMVVISADPAHMGEHVTQALRMLRPGGTLAVDGALWHDMVPDPARRDPVTTSVRQLGRTLRDIDELAVALVPVGDGLLLASR